MATDPNTPRSRRAILAAAAGSAAAVAASTVLPASVAALAAPMLTETANASGAETSLTFTDPTPLTGTEVAFKVVNSGPGAAVEAINSNVGGATGGRAAIVATNTGSDAAALVAASGDQTNISPDTTFTGAYGFAPTATAPAFGVGVWGDSDDVGSLGTGYVGVRGDAVIGVVAAGSAGGGIGLVAWGGIGTGLDTALDVRGKVKFSRSGRTTIGAGKSSVKITLLGTSTSSRVFAVLHSNRSGRYVRAVVPTTGSFTIYLNTTVTAATYVAWFVIN